MIITQTKSLFSNTRKSIIQKCAMALTVLLFLSNATKAQELLNNLSSDDSAAITALAVYPESVRKDMLQACLYPEVLLKMETLQKNSRELFKNLVSSYSKEEQQKIWNLASYPNLINRMGDGGKKSKTELEKIAADYPAEIRETAIHYGTHHYDLLASILQLNHNSDIAFENVIAEYPEATKNALRRLTKSPEVIDILTSNMKTTVILGDAYKKQPEQLEQKLDAINLEQATQNAKDYEEWKNGLEKDPQAKKEMDESATEFEKEHGTTHTAEAINEPVIDYSNYYNYNYPYWYGYPYWYAYPNWYNRPYYYNTGYYRVPQGIIYIGMPSPYYGHWYFNHGYHHYHYNHFSNYCVGYSYGRHRSYSGFNREVNHWIVDNDNRVPKNFFNADNQRPERIKELGKFENDYDKTIKSNPNANKTRDEFLNENASSYPHLNPKLNENKPQINGTVPADKPQPQMHNKPVPNYQPLPEQRPGNKPQDRPQVRPQPQPQPLPQQRPQPIPQPRPVPQERPQPQPQVRPQQPQPMPQQRPSPVPSAKPVPR